MLQCKPGMARSLNMWKNKIYILVAVGLIVDPTRAQQSPLMRDCHATDPNPYFYFGSKTAYELVNVESSAPIVVTGCQPVMFWMLARHGAIYPAAQEIPNMRDGLQRLRQIVLQNYKERRGNLCQRDADNIMNNGSLRVETEAGGMLTSSGRDELQLLGRRYRARFVDLFGDFYTPENYEVRHLPNKASQSSARAFSRGIFDVDNAILNQVGLNDPLLQFYSNCSKWNENIGNNPEAISEFEKFEKGAIFQHNLLSDVIARLGFQYNISTADLLLIYDACRYEKVWFLEHISPWCAAFNEENLKILEYGEDLQAYYLNGYGHEINYKQACPLLEDLVTRVRAKVKGDGEKAAKGIFYFTEAEGLLRFLARMGIARDEEAPTSSNYERMAQRQWRTSFLNPFSANLAFVLYQCTDGYKVQTYLKEELVTLPGCEGQLCSVDAFLKRYGDIADNCAKEDVCNSNSAPSTPSFSFVLTSTALLGHWALQRLF